MKTNLTNEGLFWAIMTSVWILYGFHTIQTNRIENKLNQIQQQCVEEKNE